MKFRVLKRTLDPGDDLGADWSRWANGQAWRLKRKRDYADVGPRVAMEAAGNAADRMGKVVLTVRDRYSPEKHIWVQFADDRIRPGSPCRCGSRKLLALHPNFLRCPQCGSLLLKGGGDDDEYESRPAYRLRQLQGIHLAWRERIDDIDIYRGYADKEGTPMIVIARFRVIDHEQVTADKAFELVHRVEIVPYDRLSDLLDLSALKNETTPGGWDLIL
jgi:hypothetical protein